MSVCFTEEEIVITFCARCIYLAANGWKSSSSE